MDSDEDNKNYNLEDEIAYIISRLEESLEKQQNTEGEIATTPIVEYCFECDKITVDSFAGMKCSEHLSVHSDGHEHGGIQSAINTLNYILIDKN